MSWNFCSSGAAIAKAGVNASSTITASGALLGPLSDEAEGFIEQQTNTDWTTTYSTLSTSVKNCLADVCSSRIAMNIVGYDLSSYSSMRLAETILDINDDIVNKGISTLKGKPDTLKTP